MALKVIYVYTEVPVGSPRKILMVTPLFCIEFLPQVSVVPSSTEVMQFFDINGLQRSKKARLPKAISHMDENKTI